MSLVKITSPKGTAVYPSLTKADTRYNAEGVFKTGLTVPAGKESSSLMETLKQVYVDEFGAKKLASAKLPYKVNEDDDSVTFNFKSKTLPKFFDSKGLPITNPTDLNIGGGSTLKIAAAAKAYNAGGATGVTMYLNAVQIIDLVEYSSNPFGAEEGGFEATAVAKFAEVAEVADESIDF